MTAVYREQWIFWAATNVFSIYLLWGESLQIQGKYLIYLINSLVGWYQWSKAAKQNTDLPNKDKKLSNQEIRQLSSILYSIFRNEKV